MSGRHPSAPSPSHSLTVAVAFFILGMCALIVVFSGCASSNTAKVLNVAVIGAGIADVATTNAALDVGRGREGNPLMAGSNLRRYVLKSSMVFAVIAGAQALEQSHPRLAQWSRVIAIVSWSSAAVLNARVMR